MCLNDTENWNFYTDAIIPFVLLKKNAKIDSNNWYQRKTLK